jgi:hypothetical protein
MSSHEADGSYTRQVCIEERDLRLSVSGRSPGECGRGSRRLLTKGEAAFAGGCSEGRPGNERCRGAPGKQSLPTKTDPGKQCKEGAAAAATTGALALWRECGDGNNIARESRGMAWAS